MDSNQNSKNTQNAQYISSENKNTNSNFKENPIKSNPNNNTSEFVKESFNFVKEIFNDDIVKDDNERIDRIHQNSKVIHSASMDIRNNILGEDKRMGELVKVYEPILKDVTNANKEMEEKSKKSCSGRYVICYTICIIMAILAIVFGLLYIFKV